MKPKTHVASRTEKVKDAVGHAVGAEQVDKRPQQREAAEHQAADDQPGSEILPLHLVARGVSDIAEQDAQEQRNGSCEQIAWSG